MDKHDIKIIYSRYAGPEKQALRLLSREIGEVVTRDAGKYILHVLACEDVRTATLDKSAVLLGVYDEHPLVRRFVAREEIPEGGYLVKVMDDPDAPERKLLIVTAHAPREVFYGAVELVDGYFAYAVPRRCEHRYHAELFSHPLPDYTRAFAPKIPVRNIFTWGHPIGDFRAYIDNMARLRFNELIVWNDFVPVNAREIVDYAHEYGIRLVFGYAWGWSRACAKTDLSCLDALADEVIATYERDYAPLGGDGIYFQSFTEMNAEYIGDRLVADAVTDFVNGVASRLLAKYPTLSIQFGLHANSVKGRLSSIARVDPRVHILWENCGSFPYDIFPFDVTEADYAPTERFTEEICRLREGASCGVLYKGHLTLDWVGENFVHQSGPFLLGEASRKTQEDDLAVALPLWRRFRYFWQKNGEFAHRLTRRILALCGTGAGVGLAGQFAGGIFYSEALAAEIIWDPDASYEEIVERISARRYLADA